MRKEAKENDKQKELNILKQKNASLRLSLAKEKQRVQSLELQLT